MSKNLSKKLAFVAVALLVVAVFSSCNRGYGCPYELNTVVDVISPLIK